MKKIIIILSCFTVLLTTYIVYELNAKQKIKSQTENFVPDPDTAIKIAEVIWASLYGESIIKEKPFNAKLIRKNVWQVYTTSKSKLGGGLYIEIQKTDCKILKVWVVL